MQLDACMSISAYTMTGSNTFHHTHVTDREGESIRDEVGCGQR
jgi:hypothetical protein